MNHEPGSAKRALDMLPDHASHDEVLARIERHWFYYRGLPFPAWDLTCGTCRGTHVRVKDWTFHKKNSRGGSSNPFRCDVRVKCMDCSAVFIFGVMLPPPDRATDYLGRMQQRVVRWREVAEQAERDVKHGADVEEG